MIKLERIAKHAGLTDELIAEKTEAFKADASLSVL
jgi:hypothetical protein